MFRILFFIPLLLACSSENNQLTTGSDNVDSSADETVEQLIAHKPQDTLFTIKEEGFREIEVRILPAENPIGTILVLPGWNYPYAHWCDSTSLCKEAVIAGFNLILLTTGKTIYQQKIYPETRSDWKRERSLPWFSQDLLQLLSENYHVLESGQGNNFILGLSTGARGAFLIGKERPDIFRAIAGLSGDYDQNYLPDDNLYRGFYGNKAQHTERYSGMENPVFNISQLEIPVYLGHGLLDEVVSPQHAMRLQKVIYDSLPGIDITLHIDKDAKHNYTYWESEISNVLNFFKEHTE